MTCLKLIKVTTHVDSSPTNTESLRLIPVSFRKVIESPEIAIKLKTLRIFSIVGKISV